MMLLAAEGHHTKGKLCMIVDFVVLVAAKKHFSI